MLTTSQLTPAQRRSASRGAIGPPMSTASRATAYSSRACASALSASPIDCATMVDRTALLPPDVPGAVGRLVYPARPGAVVRLTVDMLGTAFMAAYPWSREHGWAATN
jgi:hypothetical protein